MSGDGNDHKNIYLFEIVQPAKGFAKFGAVYKRKTASALGVALAEIMSASPLGNWDEVTDEHSVDDLDMHFGSKTQALVFVRLPPMLGNQETVFGSRAVYDLRVRRKGVTKVINNCEIHPTRSRRPKICSFEVNFPDVTAEISSHAENIAIMRLPFMFNFVDLPSNVSPVFNEPHDPKGVGTALGHGGIHPRGGSSMILLS